mgnify:CR=1 FL=1
MATAKKLHPRYITNTKGQKTAVILPIKEFNTLIEDLNDLAVVAERKHERTIPHKKVKAELKRHGYVPD